MLWDARDALERYRETGDPSRFPDLRSYLVQQNFSTAHPNYGLSGYGDKDLDLTAEEYAEMKQAYLATEAGQRDTYRSIEGEPW